MPAADLELLRERFELAAHAARRGGRGLALLAIRLPADGAPLSRPNGAGRLEDLLLEHIGGCLSRVDTLVPFEPLAFVALLERVEDGPFAVHVADRVVNALRRPLRIDGRELELPAGVGISVFPNDGDTLDELLRGADAAAQAAQASGGHMFGFHSALMNDRAGRRLALERALVGVVDRNELRLEFQPQIDTRDGSLVGAEALLRWHNPRLGRIAPVEFIPILEATGQIEEVGAWVLRAACKQAAEWARNAQPVRVSVNVSARQLRDGSLSLAVNQALQQAKLAPQLLELELTETVLVENPTSTREMMDALRRTGVRVALDDFGTGYASLAYIRHFPMDVLKIDRQFVRGLPVDAENAAITSAITALARSLRLELVAEGVETEAEEEFLHSLHCHVVQGYRHARPMSNSDLVEWRRQRPWA
jgi:EAL domain-containing protein (putative c-di-GMP-specific phosphodiesterase class I)